jgi:hypothetical protein
MDEGQTAGGVLTAYAAAITGHDWAALRGLLADDAEVVLLHTGERYDAEGFVAFNRDYPGPWAFHADEVVDGGRRGALRAHTVADQETYHVVVLGTLDGTGRLTDLVEVWTGPVAPHPERGTP